MTNISIVLFSFFTIVGASIGDSIVDNRLTNSTYDVLMIKECLGDAASNYTFTTSAPSDLEIGPREDRELELGSIDAILLTCVSHYIRVGKFGWGPLSDDSVAIIHSSLANEIGSDSGMNDANSTMPIHDANAGLTRRASHFTVIGHKDRDCPDEEYYAGEYYSIPTKCKTPKLKPYAKLLWLHNGLGEAVEIHAWPHHVCRSGGRSIWYFNPTEGVCRNKNVYSYKLFGWN